MQIHQLTVLGARTSDSSFLQSFLPPLGRVGLIPNSQFLLIGTLLAFSPLLEGGTTHAAVMGIRVLILTLWALSLVNQLSTARMTPLTSCLTLPIGAYLLIAMLSTWTSPYLHQSLQWLLTLSFYALLLYLLVEFSTDAEVLHRLVIIFLSIACFESSWGVIQFWNGLVRPHGTFFNPNFLAGYICAGWSIVLAQVCFEIGSEGVSRQAWLRLGRVGILVLFFVAILVTGSRGAMLACAAGSLLVVSVRFGWLGIAGMLLVSAVCLVIPNPWLDRLKAEHVMNFATYARIEIWKATTEEILANPMGVGLGLFQYVAPRFTFPLEGAITRYGKLAETAHNEYLQMAVELGIASVAVFFWGLVRLAREAKSLLSRNLHRRDRSLMVGASGAIVAITAHAAVDANLHEPAIAIALLFCVGIVLSLSRLIISLSSKTIQLGSTARWMWWTVSFSCLILLCIHVVMVGWSWQLFDRGYDSFRNQAVDEAISDYRRAIALDPWKSQYHGAMAAPLLVNLKQSKDWTAGETAVDELKRAIELNPLDGRLQGELGRVYATLVVIGGEKDNLVPLARRREWLSLALSSYREAVRLEPFTAPYWLELARMELALGHQAEGERVLLKAVELEPNLLPARAHLAELYLRTGRLDLALSEYRQIIERQRRYEAWRKDPDEKRFLAVDTEPLARELTKRGIVL